MEASQAQQSLAIESFSYSWLSNHRASSASDHEGASNGYQFDYNQIGSNRFLIDQSQKFNFDVPQNHSLDDHALVDADDLFSNGLIKPVFIDPSKINYNSSNSVQITNMSTSLISSSRAVVPSIRIHCCFIRRCGKLTNRAVRSLLGYLSLRPLCKRIGCSRKSTRVDDIDRREFEGRSLDTSPQASPLTLRSIKSSDCSRSAGEYWCDLESSIHEAVLHCKRSIEGAV